MDSSPSGGLSALTIQAPELLVQQQKTKGRAISEIRLPR